MTSTPAKKSSLLLIIAVAIAAVPSFCCCLFGVVSLIPGSQRTFQTIGPWGQNVGTFPSWVGFFCIGAALIPWILPLVVLIIQRRK